MTRLTGVLNSLAPVFLLSKSLGRSVRGLAWIKLILPWSGEPLGGSLVKAWGMPLTVGRPSWLEAEIRSPSRQGHCKQFAGSGSNDGKAMLWYRNST